MLPDNASSLHRCGGRQARARPDHALRHPPDRPRCVPTMRSNTLLHCQAGSTINPHRQASWWVRVAFVVACIPVCFARTVGCASPLLLPVSLFGLPHPWLGLNRQPPIDLACIYSDININTTSLYPSPTWLGQACNDAMPRESFLALLLGFITKVVRIGILDTDRRILS
jgi:hypothetical protein